MPISWTLFANITRFVIRQINPLSSPDFIQLRTVSKVYEMGSAQVVALNGLDLTLPSGQLTAIIGRSGSGKSTLLHLLAALDTPSQGRIVVGAWSLQALNRKEQARYRREMVGVVFQQFNLIPSMTALENVALPLVLGGVASQVRQERAAASLARVGLSHRLGHRPAELSGGEQQRVAIARALIHDPPLLLADEPTGNLDSVTGTGILDLFAQICQEQGKTVIIVTHHLEDLGHRAHEVINLRDGRLVPSEG